MASKYSSKKKELAGKSLEKAKKGNTEQEMSARHNQRKAHEHRIRKIDSMSQQELIRQSPHYKRMAAKMGLDK